MALWLAGAGSALAAGCPAGWSVVTTTDKGSLIALSVASPTDAWAVGSGAGSPANAISERWNGTTWTRVAVVNPGRRSNALNGVATIGPSDAWAVGGVGLRLNHTLVEHWNGTKWARVAAPSPAPRFAVLTDVYARNASDVWAVGRDGAQGHTLALHWNGHTWTHVPTPDGGRSNNELTSVTVISATNAWASGDFGSRAAHPILEHWNGTRWSLAHLPKTPGGVLISVSAASASDIWSVGTIFPGSGSGSFQPLGEHWNGSAWRVSTPPASHRNGIYNDVIATSHTDVWAVGDANVPRRGPETAIAAHSNGTTWTLGAPKTPGGISFFDSVDNVPTTTQTWAAGGTTVGGVAHILIERHC